MNINFTVFIDKILSGEKRQTIRQASPKWANVKAGDKLTLYTGQRTKQCRKLGEAVVESITPIEIKTKVSPIGVMGMVSIANKNLKPRKILELAEADGFLWVDDFFQFFNRHYGEHFVGNIIKWRDFVLAVKSVLREIEEFEKVLKAALKTSAPNVSVGSIYANWAMGAAGVNFFNKLDAMKNLSDAEKKKITDIVGARISRSADKLKSFIKWAEERGDE